MWLIDWVKRAAGLSRPAAVPFAASISPATTVDEVIARMETIDGALPERDGVACFNRMYLEVTRLVREGSAGHDFEDPQFLELLDVVFANLYFKAVTDYEAAPSSCSRAWVPLFDARSSRRIAPIQFAFAGMNAHINRDLVSAIVDTCIRLDRRPQRDSPAYRDFTYVNALLVQAQAKVEPSLKRGILHFVDRFLGHADEAAENWSMARAREAAWVQAETLWALRDDADLSAQWLLVVDRTVGFAGRGLLIERLI